MKLRTVTKLTGALLAGVLLSLFTANTFAANTAAGTTISNLATVNYSVNGVAQSAVGSSSTGNSSGAGTATTFLVDDKLLLSLVTNDTADINVTPGQTGAVLVFKVTNSGNATQGVTFTTVNESNGVLGSTAGAGFTGTDNFDATGVSVFVSKNNTATYVPANDTASSIPQLAAGASNFVFIVANIPAAQVDTDVAALALKAQVAAAGGSATYGTAPGANITTDDSGNAWTPGTQQNIFADAAGLTGDGDATHDGIVSARDVYLVKSAKLTITKTSSVVSDPTGDATPHAIPGAVIKYTITVANAGTTAATGITLADSISTQLTNITYVTNSITLTDPNVNSGNPLSCADAGSSGGSFGSDTCSYTSGTSTVNALINSLTNGQTATITFNVTIN
ncbi:MAG TPA: hypothetical protein VLV87_09565 [Gammaproteobacteria bacterium]|nr:hypothetical protein [Gammaproteobacteria bacterium]